MNILFYIISKLLKCVSVLNSLTFLYRYYCACYCICEKTPKEINQSYSLLNKGILSKYKSAPQKDAAVHKQFPEEKMGKTHNKKLRKQKKRAIKTAQMRHLKNLLSTHFKMVCDYQMLIRSNAYPDPPQQCFAFIQC